MSHTPGSDPSQQQLADVQTALFNLRDGLMNLKMSLLELACVTDPDAQRMASVETDELLSRLRS